MSGGRLFTVSHLWEWKVLVKMVVQDFPGGAVVKNLPATAGDTGSIPGPGRSHMPQSNYARVPQLLSLCSRACEPQLLSPHTTTTEAHVPRAHASQREATAMRSPCTTIKSSPCSLQLEKARTQQQRPNAAKKKDKKKGYSPTFLTNKIKWLNILINYSFSPLTGK